MTGGTSGIGRRALRKLLSERANWSVILFARPSPQADALRSLPGASDRLAIVSADLASLGSVDRACGEVVRLLGPRPIDALALNAGVQTVTGAHSSADGLELAFAVNFLAHFLIVERLKGLLRSGGRIVITSSEVHDPEAFCLMGIGRATWQDPLVLADFRSLAGARGQYRRPGRGQILRLQAAPSHVRPASGAGAAGSWQHRLQPERGARDGHWSRSQLGTEARMEVHHARLGAHSSRGPVTRAIRRRSLVAPDRGGCTNPLRSLRRRQDASAGLE